MALLEEPVLYSVATADGGDSSDSSDAENEDGGSNRDPEAPFESAASRHIEMFVLRCAIIVNRYSLCHFYFTSGNKKPHQTSIEVR